MDDKRFDDLVRDLPVAGSRRSVLKVLAGGAFGGLLARFGLRPDAAEAQDVEAAFRSGNCTTNAQCRRRVDDPCKVATCRKRFGRQKGLCIVRNRPNGTTCNIPDDEYGEGSCMGGQCLVGTD